MALRILKPISKATEAMSEITKPDPVTFGTTVGDETYTVEVDADAAELLLDGMRHQYPHRWPMVPTEEGDDGHTVDADGNTTSTKPADISAAQFFAICCREWAFEVARGYAAHLDRGDTNQRAVMEARSKVNAQVSA